MIGIAFLAIMSSQCSRETMMLSFSVYGAIFVSPDSIYHSLLWSSILVTCKSQPTPSLYRQCCNQLFMGYCSWDFRPSQAGLEWGSNSARPSTDVWRPSSIVETNVILARLTRFDFHTDVGGAKLGPSTDSTIGWGGVWVFPLLLFWPNLTTGRPQFQRQLKTVRCWALFVPTCLQPERLLIWPRPWSNVIMLINLLSHCQVLRGPARLWVSQAGKNATARRSIRRLYRQRKHGRALFDVRRKDLVQDCIRRAPYHLPSDSVIL